MDLSHWPAPYPGGAKHLLVMHDQINTLFVCALPVRKSDASEIIQQFILTCEISLGVKFTVVHSDRDEEFKNSKF